MLLLNQTGCTSPHSQFSRSIGPFRRCRMRPQRSVTVATLVAMAAMLFPVVPASAQTKVKPGMNFFSINQDIQMGRQAAAQVEQQTQIVNDPVIQEWIDTLGHRLSSVTTMPNLPWRFRVTNSRQVNAFALPGGFVYVNRGLIEMTNSEAELAGVMGHEMAHVTLRHGTNQLSKKLLATAPLAVVGMMGPGGYAMSQVGSMGLSMTFLKFSRLDEQQADIVGTQTMVKAGYDPHGMVTIFQKLERLGSGKNTPEFLSDHPNPANRAKRIEEEIAKLSVPTNPLQSSTLYAQAKDRFRDLGPGSFSNPVAQSGYGRRRGSQGSQYPGGGNYPDSQYPGGGNYPDSQYPGGNYPDSRYPSSRGGNYPDSSYPRSGGNYPSTGSDYPPPSDYPDSGSSNDGYHPPILKRGNPNGSGNQSSSQQSDQSGDSANNRNGQTGDIAASGELPSNDFKTFKSSDGVFQVGYPANWNALYQSQGKVTFAPDWAIQQNNISHGAILGYVSSEGVGQSKNDLDTVMNAVIKKLGESNKGITEETGARYTGMLAGSPALATFLTENNTQGAVQQNWLIVGSTGHGILYMMFVCPRDDFDRYQPAFQAMIKSFALSGTPPSKTGFKPGP